MISTSFPGKFENTQGVNLLTGTRDFSGDGWEISTAWRKEIETYNGLTVYSHAIEWDGIANKITPDAGIYTFSLYAKTESPTEIRIYATNGKPDNSSFTSTREWKRYYHTFETDGSKELSLRMEATASGPRMYICGYKLERGTVPNPVWTPAPEDIVTKTPYDIFEALDPIPEAHRNNYRGRNLGESTKMSQAHKDAIADGSFKDLFVGDYWTHGGFNYRIADADYLWNCGDKAFTTHHLVIVPDTQLYNAQMNAENTTANGYVGSEMRTKNLEEAKAKIAEAFPDMVLTHRDYLVNKVTDGKPSGGEWTNSDIELMNEIMVYGTHIFAPENNVTIAPNKYTTGNSQFALFRLNPRMIKTRYGYWLRDVVSADYFANVNAYGLAHFGITSDSYGVRPYFCIGVQAAGDEEEEDMEVIQPR